MTEMIEAHVDTITLNLPDDVKPEPTTDDLVRLTDRLNASGHALNEARAERNQTPVAGLPEKFGEDGNEYGHGPAVLIAIPTKALDDPHFRYSDRTESTALPEMEDLYETTDNFVDIPPIFMFWHSQKEKYVTADGRHRLFVAQRDKKFPYILAYVPKKDLIHFTKNNIPYKLVVGQEAS